jgi:hypothetical protein
MSLLSKDRLEVAWRVSVVLLLAIIAFALMQVAAELRRLPAPAETYLEATDLSGVERQLERMATATEAIERRMLQSERRGLF